MNLLLSLLGTLLSVHLVADVPPIAIFLPLAVYGLAIALAIGLIVGVVIGLTQMIRRRKEKKEEEKKP